VHRYSRLGYVALNVSDPQRSRHFYETLWGLEVSETGPAGELFLRCSDDHHNIILYSSAQPGLKRIGWELESERDLDELAAILGEHGLAVREVDAAERAVLHQGRTLRFSDPFTLATHEFYAAQRNLGGVPFRPTVAKIQRLGHIVLWTERYDEAVDFYLNVLNFRASDIVEGFVTFMRCFPNPFHHSFGLANGKIGGKRSGLHHVNFMVTEIDDVGRGLWRFHHNDVPVVRGPGRHPPSGSIFLYVLDPDQLTMEYSFGMEEFPEHGARKPRFLAPVPESIDFWDCPRDPRQGAVGEVEVAAFAAAVPSL